MGKRTLRGLAALLGSKTVSELLDLNKEDDDAFATKVAALLGKAITSAEQFQAAVLLAMHGNTPEDIELANSFSLVAAYDSVNIKGLGKDGWGTALLLTSNMLHLFFALLTTMWVTAWNTMGAGWRPDVIMVLSLNACNTLSEVSGLTFHARECTPAGKLFFRLFLPILWLLFRMIMWCIRLVMWCAPARLGWGRCDDIANKQRERLAGTFCSQEPQPAWTPAASELWEAVKGMFHGSWGERKSAINGVYVSLVKMTQVNKFAPTCEEFLLVVATNVLQAGLILVFGVWCAKASATSLLSALTLPPYLNLTMFNTVSKDMLGAWVVNHQCAMGGRVVLLLITALLLMLACIVGILHWVCTVCVLWVLGILPWVCHACVLRVQGFTNAQQQQLMETNV